MDIEIIMNADSLCIVAFDVNSPLSILEEFREAGRALKRKIVWSENPLDLPNADAVILFAQETGGISGRVHFLARVLSTFNVRHVVLAVDSGGSSDDSAAEEFIHLCSKCGLPSVHVVPFSRLLGHLEKLDVAEPMEGEPFSMVVQRVDRENPAVPAYFGRMTGGKVRAGDRVRIVPGGIATKVRSVVTEGDCITLLLEEEVDTEKGAVIASCESPVELSDQFEARVVCLSERRLVPGRPYLLGIHESQANATVTDIKYVIDPETAAHLAAKTLGMNDIGVVNLSTSKPLPFEPYDKNRMLGSFTLTDKASKETVAAGMIEFALRRASNIHWQGLSINKAARAELKHQKPRCLWFTGLSGSGKSTIASLLEKRLFALGRHTYVLDGDNVRHGLNRDLGFTEADRVENIRRVAEVAKLMVDAGLMVIVSFLSPFRSEREFARSLFEEGEFFEIYVDTPFEECEKRDTKGLYAKARRGELKNFTGIDSPYESPESPEIRLETLEKGPEACVDRILEAIDG